MTCYPSQSPHHINRAGFSQQLSRQSDKRQKVSRAEEGTRQHCCDNGTMFSGHTFFHYAICLYDCGLTSLRPRGLSILHIFSCPEALLCTCCRACRCGDAYQVSRAELWLLVAKNCNIVELSIVVRNIWWTKGSVLTPNISNMVNLWHCKCVQKTVALS